MSSSVKQPRGTKRSGGYGLRSREGYIPKKLPRRTEKSGGSGGGLRSRESLISEKLPCRTERSDGDGLRTPEPLAAEKLPRPIERSGGGGGPQRAGHFMLEKLPIVVFDRLLSHISLDELNMMRSVSKQWKRFVEKINAREYGSVLVAVKHTLAEINSKIASDKPPAKWEHSLGKHSIAIERLHMYLDAMLRRFNLFNRMYVGCPMYFGRFIDVARAFHEDIHRRAFDCKTVVPMPSIPREPQPYKAVKGIYKEVDFCHFFNLLWKHLFSSQQEIARMWERSQRKQKVLKQATVTTQSNDFSWPSPHPYD